eukprot:gb/GECG01016240.1/.p1 GENE.gb/GECG01016240.1/~~gb/GECG01016240.1/.p1  ORF type:complete len:137 (+),score=30.81 gb/GECG01016240.1/:1-411(+)
MMGLTPAEQDVDVEVRYDDQLQINEFGRLNQDKNELQNELDEMKRKMDNYTQAEEELDELECFVDEEEKGSAKLFISECFIDSTIDEAKAFLAKYKQKDSDRLKQLTDDMEAKQKRLDELKKVLYARFGNSINLEQ